MMSALQHRCTKDFTVHTFDIDPTYHATEACLFRCMQEVAIIHVEQLGLGLAAVSEKQQSWVLAKMLLEINQLPKLHDVITVQTWSNGVSGQFALREYTVKNRKGVLLAAACSHWLLLDQANQKICRVSEIFPQPDGANKESALRRGPKRVKVPREWSERREHVSRYSELDFNGHVNHIRYIEHALDMVPEGLRETHRLRELELEFLQASAVSDPLVNRLAQGPVQGEFVHSLFNERVGKNAFSARSRWQALAP